MSSFLKWTGGKRQLLPELHKRMDPVLDAGGIDTYVEPFIGGGALMWDVVARGDVAHVYFGDMNGEMINLYKAVWRECEPLCSEMGKLSADYFALASEGARKDYYYARRKEYNALVDKHPDSSYGPDSVRSAALFVFLNRTCFNGLYRVNKDNHYNVPFGKYKTPAVDQSAAVRKCSGLLSGVGELDIEHASYEKSLPLAKEGTFVYLDPPYRPLPGTPSFTSYAKSGFNDDDQRALAEYCKSVDAAGGKFMLSNSDPHNTDPSDDFFDDLYADFTVERVKASRNINSKGDGRGKIDEILVRNF